MPFPKVSLWQVFPCKISSKNLVVVYLSGSCFFAYFLLRDHPEATQQMNDLIIAKVSAALKGHWANPDLVWPLTCATKLYKLRKKN